MPNITAVIPTRNRPLMAAEAVQSVVNQTHPPDEIVVVDDGDGSAAEELAGQFDIKTVHTNGKGPAVARNEGVAAAHGEWIAFCDDDDVWLPERLAKQADRIEDDVDLIYADAWHGENTRELQGREAREGLVFTSLLLDNWIPTSTVLVRRAAIKQAGGFESQFSPAEDYRLWLRISRFSHIRKIDEPLAVYRQHAGQLQTDIAGMAGATAAVIEDAIKEVGWRVAQIPNLTTRLRELRFVQGRALAAGGKFGPAREAYLQAWRSQPAYFKAPLFWLLSFFGK